MLPKNPVEKLLTVFESQADIAAFCYVHRSTVTYWRETGRIPHWHVRALSAHTSIPERELCPQHFLSIPETTT
jgi:hypothetical protein